MKTITVKELKNILDQHKLWSESLGQEGICVNLEGANLYNASLTGANLEDASLTGASLCGANLANANLTGANLCGANLANANLEGASLYDADLTGADLTGANLTVAIGLPDISWIIPGCLAQLNNIKYLGFYAGKERKHDNFIQDSIGFIIQDNMEEKTFDILAGDRIIRGIPDWVKYSGIKQIELVSV